MSNYIRIAGNPATGIVLLDGDGAVRSLGQVGTWSAWMASPQAAGFVPGETAFACLRGDGAGFVTVAHGTAIRYLSVLGQQNARWKDVALPPAGTGIAGLAGAPWRATCCWPSPVPPVPPGRRCRRHRSPSRW